MYLGDRLSKVYRFFHFGVYCYKWLRFNTTEHQKEGVVQQEGKKQNTERG